MKIGKFHPYLEKEVSGLGYDIIQAVKLKIKQTKSNFTLLIHKIAELYLHI